MELTYDSVIKWFDAYFKAFNKNAGPLKTVPNMERYFTPDMEFWSYNMPGAVRPAPRESLLRSMIHPGLHEELTPRDYIVDLKRMAVVVQFQLQFNDEITGKVWPPSQASAHYYLVLDENKDLKIKKIMYFTEYRAPEVTKNLHEIWDKYRDQALAGEKK